MALGAQLGLIVGFLYGGGVEADEQKPAQPDATQSAITWIELLKSGNTAKLAASSHLPFVLRGFNDCATKKATDAGNLTIALNCAAHSEHLFIESIPDDRPGLSHWQPLKRADVPREYRQLAKQLSATHALIGGVIEGNGIAYNVVVAIAHDGTVGALLVDLARYDDSQ